MSNRQMAIKPSEADIHLIEETRHLARELSPTEAAELCAAHLLYSGPPIDYSNYVTLIRNQDSAGGCGTMSSVAILDILKERERPFSPDASFKFAAYVYNAAKIWREQRPDWEPDPRVPYDPDIEQLKVLQKYGCCSESSYPTDFDKSTVPMGDPPPKNEWPSDANFNEAKMYRIGAYKTGDAILKPSVEVLKALLYDHGPVFIMDLYIGHVVTLIGYDNHTVASDGSTGGFIILNSWGDQWETNGMVFYSYHEYNAQLNRSSNQPQITVRWVNNSPTPPFAHPYTARIRINHHDRRNRLKVSIGVAGYNPVIVWDTPQVDVMADDSKYLTLDVPLPPYAHKCWPPSEEHRWYIQVRDYEPPPMPTHPFVIGEVKEIALVYRHMVTPIKCIPQIYRASSSNIPIVSGGSTEIYIPAIKHYSLDLAVDLAQVTSGDTIVFSGTFLLDYVISDRQQQIIPQAGHEIWINKKTYDPIEGEINWPIGTATTDQRGHFTLAYAPTETADYEAVATKPDATVIVTSNNVKVSVT